MNPATWVEIMERPLSLQSLEWKVHLYHLSKSSSAESFSEFPHAIFDTLANRVDGSSLKPKSTSKKDYMRATHPKQFENPKLWKAKGKCSYETKEQKEILNNSIFKKSSCSYFFSLTSRLPKSGNGHAPPATLKEPVVECTKLHPKTCPWWMFTNKHLHNPGFGVGKEIK